MENQHLKNISLQMLQGDEKYAAWDDTGAQMTQRIDWAESAITRGTHIGYGNRMYKVKSCQDSSVLAEDLDTGHQQQIPIEDFVNLDPTSTVYTLVKTFDNTLPDPRLEVFSVSRRAIEEIRDTAKTLSCGWLNSINVGD